MTDSRKQHDDWSLSPFALMRQGIDEADRWFSRMVGHRSSSPPWASSRTGRGGASSMTADGDWSPAIEVFQRGNELIVRVDVPGMKRHEITVEAADDSLIIRGERRQEQTQEGDGLFWTERSYGTFSRVVPLPPGAIVDSAKATFNNGVLEVVMQAPPPEARRGRKIDISGAPGEHRG
jgi:HSP20 family protein